MVHATTMGNLPCRRSAYYCERGSCAGSSRRRRAMNSTGGKTYLVRLDDDECGLLRGVVDGGKGSKERRRRAQSLLPTDENRAGGGCRDADIADVLTIWTVTFPVISVLLGWMHFAAGNPNATVSL